MIETRNIGTRFAFRVNGLPHGEPRHRHVVATGRVYTDTSHKAHAWKKSVRAAALDSLSLLSAPIEPIIPLGTPISLDLFFTFPRPAKHHVARDKAREIRENAPAHHTAKPDADNLAKAVMDSLANWPKHAKPILWGDDSVVSDLSISKRYGDHPGAVVRVFSPDPLKVIAPFFIEQQKPERSHDGQDQRIETQGRCCDRCDQ